MEKIQEAPKWGYAHIFPKSGHVTAVTHLCYILYYVILYHIMLYYIKYFLLYYFTLYYFILYYN